MVYCELLSVYATLHFTSNRQVSEPTYRHKRLRHQHRPGKLLGIIHFRGDPQEHRSSGVSEDNVTADGDRFTELGLSKGDGLNHGTFGGRCRSTLHTHGDRQRYDGNHDRRNSHPANQGNFVERLDRSDESCAITWRQLERGRTKRRICAKGTDQRES